METFFTPADHQSISPYKKQMKHQSKRNNISSSNRSIRGFISRPTENLAPSNYNHSSGSRFFLPPPHALSFSYPPSYNCSLYPNQQNHQRQRQQPPLLPLPLPISRSHSFSLPPRMQDLSSPPPPLSSAPKKTNRTKDHSSLTPKKSKPKKQEPKQDSKPYTKSLTINASNVPSGPDPNDLPKDVSKILASSSSSPASSSFITGNGAVFKFNNVGVVVKDLERFTTDSVVFTLSPPPSSLPLPKFSIRPKVLSCTAEAAEVDNGATDDLRKLLRLR